MNKEKFWNELTKENKEKANILLKDYKGSDGVIGRIFELYEEGASSINLSVDEYMEEVTPNEYVEICYESSLY